MISVKKHGYYTSTTMHASYVDKTSPLKFTTFSEESRPHLSTLLASVIDAMPKSRIADLNTEEFLRKLLNSSEKSDTNQKNQTGNLSKTTQKSFCQKEEDHEWKPDYEAYGWDKDGGATIKNPSKCVLPDNMLSLKISSKCGKKK